MSKRLYPSNPAWVFALNERQVFTTQIYCTDGCFSSGEFWQYPGPLARDAFLQWAERHFLGEPPDGWVRAMTRGPDGEWLIRRRTDGDPRKEYLDGEAKI